jgi:alpha-D-ribose 1-methylphosphonate 5-triphosphate synthase subunit PhnG
VSGVALASTAAVVEEESDDAQGFGHVPGQSGRQIIRSALNADRLLQSQPRHNQQL